MLPTPSLDTDARQLVVHSMSGFFTKISYESCSFSTSGEAAIASEHYLDITIRIRLPDREDEADEHERTQEELIKHQSQGGQYVLS